MLRVNGKRQPFLSEQELGQFRSDGIVYLESFYDLHEEVLPIQESIYQIISLIIKENRLSIRQQEFSPVNFDSGLQEIIKHHRKFAGVLYDAVKKLPSYVRLANSRKNETLAKLLIGTDSVGFANRGYGMRMDNPSEDVHLTQWHQDYVSQLCSKRGVVLWSPLRNVTRDVGPVEIAVGSHRDGVFPIIRDGAGSYGLKIKNEASIIGSYLSIVPEVNVGDLVAIDFLTLHRSSPNRSRATRWAMISRYFDFLEKTGMSYGWKGGLQEGNSFENVHPELAEIVG